MRLSGGRGSVAPKTLFDKARSDVRRKAVIYAPASKTIVAASPTNAALLVQTPTRPINVTTTIKPAAPTVKMTQVAIPPPSDIGVKRPLPEGSPPSPTSKHPLNGIDTCPENKHIHLPVSKPAYYPLNPNPLKRSRGADALFMPKHAILPVPSRAR
jgi:hypothetical protein